MTRPAPKRPCRNCNGRGILKIVHEGIRKSGQQFCHACKGTGEATAQRRKVASVRIERKAVG